MEFAVSLLQVWGWILVAMLLFPSAISKFHTLLFRQTVTWLIALQFGLCVAVAVARWLGFPADEGWKWLNATSVASLIGPLRVDSLALLMLTLVSFLGWVLCSYSIRYLDGDTHQGTYYRWTACALGAVSLMVAASNLAMFGVAWVLTSIALHQLLLLYRHRPAARRAAWSKFAISRIGDVALFVAMILLYREYGTLDFSELHRLASSQLRDGTEPFGYVDLSTFLIALCAITKSAQLPFHTWLPLTMETPTPVSALMHAGIVNGGGYLLLRTSSLMALQPWALTVLVVVGAVTLLVAAVVMTTQSSVKKKLAYSTIAQMGFMILQCGLGAFSAAMLHIVTHSLFKAHAFLQSGTLPPPASKEISSTQADRPFGWTLFSGLALLMLAGISLAMWTFHINPWTKAGGIALTGILTLALTQWVSQIYQTGRIRLMVRSIVWAMLLAFLYVASFAGLDHLLQDILPTQATPAIYPGLTLAVLLSYLLLIALQRRCNGSRPAKWLDAWYVHALNGFYVESFLRGFGNQRTAPAVRPATSPSDVSI